MHAYSQLGPVCSFTCNAHARQAGPWRVSASPFWRAGRLAAGRRATLGMMRASEMLQQSSTYFGFEPVSSDAAQRSSQCLKLLAHKNVRCAHVAGLEKF